jgi:RNA polymerase sigma factor (sigma-70 family)
LDGEDDRTRFNRVVLPYLEDGFAFARWLTGNRADAEDVLQEACLRAFRAVRTFSGGNARAWLLTIVRRSAYSWLEKNRMRAQVAVDDLSPGERAFVERGGGCDPLHTATAETELIAKADAARLETAISALPLEFREVFVLREIEGLDYRAIAEVTAMPLGTVMSRLARARRRLTDTLGARQ